MYQYQIDYWAPPTSGFDLARKAQDVSIIRSIIDSIKEEYPEEIDKIHNSFDNFLEEGDGCILNTITIETESPIESIKDFRSIVLQKSPYAKLISYTPILTE